MKQDPKDTEEEGVQSTGGEGEGRKEIESFLLGMVSLMCLQNEFDVPVQGGVWGWSSRTRLGNMDLRISDLRW